MRSLAVWPLSVTPTLPEMSSMVSKSATLLFDIPIIERTTAQKHNPILSYPILSHPILSYPIPSHPILSYPILSHPILSYPILSYPKILLMQAGQPSWGCIFA